MRLVPLQWSTHSRALLETVATRSHIRLVDDRIATSDHERLFLLLWLGYDQGIRADKGCACIWLEGSQVQPDSIVIIVA